MSLQTQTSKIIKYLENFFFINIIVRYYEKRIDRL